MVKRASKSRKEQKARATRDKVRVRPTVAKRTKQVKPRINSKSKTEPKSRINSKKAKVKADRRLELLRLRQLTGLTQKERSKVAAKQKRELEPPKKLREPRKTLKGYQRQLEAIEAHYKQLLADKDKELKAERTKRARAFIQDLKERKDHKLNVFKHRKEIIGRVLELRELEDDLEDYEREEVMDEIKEEYELDFEEWQAIMMAEGFSLHETYELWYYP